MVDLQFREDLKAAYRPNLGVYSLGARQEIPNQGLISIGVLLGVMSQMSIMSEFETAMQPFVQSNRSESPAQRAPSP